MIIVLKSCCASWRVAFASFSGFRRSSQAFSEWGARLPGRRGTLWPFHWYQWHPATEVCHTPTQPQPIWGGARAAVGPGRAEGEKGEGQATGTCDGEKRRAQDQQWGAHGQRGRPSYPQPFQWRVASRHKPVHLQLQTQVTCSLFCLNQKKTSYFWCFMRTECLNKNSLYKKYIYTHAMKTWKSNV